jgi:hypothetical protein
MVSTRTTYQGGQGGQGTAPPGDTFVWVSLAVTPPVTPGPVQPALSKTRSP